VTAEQAYGVYIYDPSLPLLSSLLPPFFLLCSFSPLLRLKLSYSNRLELSVGNEILRPNEDRRLVSNIPLRDRMVSG